MDRRARVMIAGALAVVLIILISLGVMVVGKFTPSKEVLPLTDYYKVEEGQVLVILQDHIYEKKGLFIDGKVYIDYDTVKTKFNHRFYWDQNENILIYTTPTEILQTEIGSNQYSVTKSMIKTKTDVDYQIVKVFADHVYIALDYVKQYSDITFEYFDNPGRVLINYKWGEALVTDVTKATQMRKDPNIKSPLVTQLAAGVQLTYVNLEEAPKKGFAKVMTSDGIIGYVKEKNLKKSYYKEMENSDYEAPKYTPQTRSGKINMAFNVISNQEANNYLADLIKPSKGVNVVAPTWFSISDNTGNFNSFASQSYVDKANDLGLEVWAVVDNFNSGNEIDMKELLSRTSYRENLSNSLVQAALDYKLNGINIDFEKIPSASGEDYIEFLRELSVKCRNNGIVLSVDNYVPTPYTKYYNKEEQGEILDYVIIMAYDEHYAGSDEAGPVSSIGFVKDAVSNTLDIVPKDKIIIAIPFYTRLWKETADGELTSSAYAMTPAENILKDNKAEPAWDNAAGCYYAQFQQDGATYRIWQEEEKSIEEKLKVIYKADVAGIAEWRLGHEKASIWDVIVKYYN